MTHITTALTSTGLDWNRALLDQLTWHWDNQLRPHLDGLTDQEYLWEPVAGCWNVRPGGTSTAPVQGGSGAMTIDFAFPEPDPAPVTTIAWRLGHIIVGVLGVRCATHFAGPAMDYMTHDYAATADAALTQLDAGYTRWVDGVRGLDARGLLSPCGPSEGPFAELSMAELVLHIHREMLHHGAEIALLRELYRFSN